MPRMENWMHTLWRAAVPSYDKPNAVVGHRERNEGR